MSRRVPSRLTFLVPSVVCFAFAASVGVQLLRGLEESAYWTPQAMAPTLNQSRDRVEVYRGEELLERQAERGELRDGQGRQIQGDEFRVRFNEFDRIARGQMVVLTATLTAGIVLLLVGIVMPKKTKGSLGR